MFTQAKDLNCNQKNYPILTSLINCASLSHQRSEDFGVRQEVMAEHFDDEIELTQVLPFLCDFKPHQVVVRELPRGQWFLCALRHQANVLLLVKHVHQYLETDSGHNQLKQSNAFECLTNAQKVHRSN